MTSSAAPRPFRRRVLINTSTTAAANVWAMVVAFATVPILLSGLGPTQFGLWALLTTFSALNGWLSLGDIGLATATPRFLAEARSTGADDRVHRLLGTSVASFAALGAFWALLLALLGPAILPTVFRVPAGLQGEFATSIVIIAAMGAVDQAARGCQASLEGLQRVDLSRAGDMVRRTTVAVGTGVAALTTHDLVAVSAAALAASVAGLAFSAVTLRLVHRAPILGFDRAAASTLFGYGRTVAVLRPIGVVHRMMDRVIVGVVLGPAAVSVVEVATQVQNGAEAVLSASSYSVVPSAAHLQARGDRHTMRELVLTGSRYSLLVTMPFVIAPAIAAGPLLQVWLGGTGVLAATPVALALAYVACTAPLQVGSNLLVGTGRAGAVVRAAGASIIVNLAASIALVQVWGVSGAFAATLLSGLLIVPLLGRAVLVVTDLERAEFARAVLAPLVVPCLALAAAVGLVVALPLAPLPTLLVAAGVGGPAYLTTAARHGMQPGELRNLLRTVLPAPSEATAA